MTHQRCVTPLVGRSYGNATTDSVFQLKRSTEGVFLTLDKALLFRCSANSEFVIDIAALNNDRPDHLAAEFAKSMQASES